MAQRIKLATVAAMAVALAACTTNPQTGQQEMSKTAMYGLGGAAACGIVGAMTHGGKGARNAALGCGVVGAGVGAYMDHQEKLLREKLAGSQVQVNRNGDQINLVMPENITFALNSAELRPNVRTSLDDVSKVLAQYTDTSITVSGHTDSTGTQQLNQALSERRASSVGGYLQGKGVAGARIRTVGFGPNQPVASNTSAEGRAKNRRVEINITPKT
ncbi:OmpA family protein [Crenobacter cavernae]|uniref:Glycine zipper 2TM domain-containing protein n=1 Tax=Crenobacter cavernae TaxID=2290923 RepID=A0A345Y2E6_9NEIS|nr:OmpA family protein [Crenobacter cavernae]AXK38098.1 glycine zipper 2TM domain-containing protein [Crenobacter cavernae]